MTKKDPDIYLHHILDSINLIEKYLEGVTEEQFYNWEEKQDVILRRLEIIGEATKNIPIEFRDLHDDIPWKEMAGMRDVAIHQYFNIDLSVVWDSVKNLLPGLKNQIQAILRDNNLNE